MSYPFLASEARGLDATTRSSAAAFLNARATFIVIGMTVLQLGWLCAIWFLGVSGNEGKVLLLLGYTAIAGLVVLVVPCDALHARLTALLLDPRLRLVAFLGVALVVGVIYAAEQRVWRYDEEGLYAAAKSVSEGGPLSLFHSYDSHPWLGRQHPPLAPLAYGAFLSLFGDQLFVARLLSLALLIAVGVLTFLIGKELYDARTGALAAGFLLTMPLMWRIGTAAMVEPLLVFLFSATLFLMLRFVRNPGTWLGLAMGLTFACGMITKYTMLLILPVLFGFCAIRLTPRMFAKVVGLGALVGLPLLSVWAFYTHRDGLLYGHIAWIWYAALQVFMYDYGRELLFETMTNRLPSALGVYNLPLIGIALFQLLRRRQRSDWLLLCWIVPVFAILSLTLPDHRYFMVLFPAFSISMASCLASQDTRTTRILLLALLLCAGSLYLFVDWDRVNHLFLEKRFVG